MVDVDPEHSPSGDEPSDASGKTSKKKKKGNFWKELPVLILVAFGLAIAIQIFLGRVYMIPSESMETTLHGCTDCYGDRVLVDKVTYRFTEPAPGDVIVFRGPPSWQNDFISAEPGNPISEGLSWLGSLIGLPSANEEDFVKRVIAVGGQTVKCCDEQNRVTVDGKALDEPYKHFDEGVQAEQESFEELKIPDGMLFVLGDNRNHSCDSRCQGQGGLNGLVPVDNVIGKARVIVLPPSRWGGVSDHNPQVVSMGAPGWQENVPLGVGIVAPWPLLLLGRRVRDRFRR
ncbi:signal peptidase I [Lentzea xinjiangensis]|uniref:Signal peptidase I n=1 Tax=Lentzea xinjiangensis TaxID=402600 RepID=A0A1H9Q6G6_9PSEU|nr:signal peptidase I [Lentzea xinjiangensis]SER56156.1 signal peptidase I [Lentzea xinjiangensis]